MSECTPVDVAWNLQPFRPVAAAPLTTVKAAMAVMRDAVATLEAQPADLDAGYTEDEVAAQYAATDRIVEAFHLLDRLLTNR
ncbi:MAG TPA: hypothetical protein VKI00_00035 [Mycobacterium sp.]|jgi:hypothetical protein|uniref:hypothetical protein n=1 Tax=Mycobacterium sp. TaxID=1785 RepID=UPI002CB48435|nr:hypothetical protein [Mycobacterium sp.]HME74086.1 hypothetical protein [Mycobacterium sp.]